MESNLKNVYPLEHRSRFAFPIPDFKAEEAARDLASDARKVAAEILLIEEAQANEAISKSDAEHLEELRENLTGILSVCFVCVDTKREYHVKDFVTKRREILAGMRWARMMAAYNRLMRTLKEAW